MNKICLFIVLIHLCGLSGVCQHSDIQDLNYKNDLLIYLNKQKICSSGTIHYSRRLKQFNSIDTLESTVELTYQKINYDLLFPFNYNLCYSVFLDNELDHRNYLNSSFFYELDNKDKIIAVRSNRKEKDYIKSTISIDIYMPLFCRPDVLKQYIELMDGNFELRGEHLYYWDEYYTMWINPKDYCLERIQEILESNDKTQFVDIVFISSDFDSIDNDKLSITGKTYFDNYRINNINCKEVDNVIGYCPGTPSPIEKIVLSDNSVVQLSNVNTDYSFLYFYNRFCGACPKVVHELQSFRDLYNGRIGLIGICIGDNDVDAIHTNMIDHDYSPQYSIDSLKQTWASFNLFTVPSTIILDSDGIIIGGFQGYDKNMKRDIKKLIKEYDGSF